MVPPFPVTEMSLTVLISKLPSRPYMVPPVPSCAVFMTKNPLPAMAMSVAKSLEMMLPCLATVGLSMGRTPPISDRFCRLRLSTVENWVSVPL